jgi:hypothetical protein
MRRYHFDLVDTDMVTDAGGSLLHDDEQARKVAHNLVQDVRETRPELVGRGYVVVVRSDAGREILRTAIDHPAEDGDGGQ